MSANTKKPFQPDKISLTSSLKNRLLLWFLLLTLLPLTILSSVSYLQSRASLTSAATNELKQSSLVNSYFIENWFEYRFLDINSLAENLTNITLLKTLTTAWRESKLPLDNFVNTSLWLSVVKDTHTDLLNFYHRYDYIHDVLIFDQEGNILSNITKGSDLGTNLLHGESRESLFAETVKNTLLSGNTLFSGIERYQPSQDLLSGFISAAITDDVGRIIGGIAIQIKLDRIYQLLGNTFENEFISHYIVDPSGEIQTPVKDNWKYILNKAVDNQVITSWIKNSPNNKGTINYTNIDNIDVISIQTPVTIENIRWLLLSEISSEDALTGANWLGKITLLLVLLSALITTVIAIIVSKKITLPIERLSEASLNVAAGNNQPIEQKTDDEIGQLTDAFNYMTKVRHEQQVDLKQKNRLLSDKSNQLSLVIDNTGVGFWDWDIIHGSVSCNTMWYEITGYTEEELSPFTVDSWGDLLHPDDLTNVMMSIEQHFLNENIRYNYELRIKHKLGHWIYVHDSGKVVSHTDNGQPSRMISTMLDITHRKESERKLAHSEAFSRGIFNSVADGIISMDIRGGIQSFNPAAEKMYGYFQDELLGNSITDIIRFNSDIRGVDFQQYLAAHIHEILNKDIKVEGLHQDGTTFLLKLTMSKVSINNELYYTAMVRDITLQKINDDIQKTLHQAIELKLNISKALAQDNPLKICIDSGLKELFKFDDLHKKSSGGVFILPKDKKELQIVSHQGDLMDDALILEKKLMVDNKLWRKSVKQGEIIISNDCVIDSKYSDNICHNVGDHGHYIIPLIHRSEGSYKTIGILFLYTDVNPTRNSDRTRLLKEISDMFSAVIIQENAKILLEEATGVAHQNSQLKSEFLASMSHEIRTPMNGVLGMLGLLLNSNLDTDQHHKASLAKSSAESLLSLINDILDFSKVEAGKMELESIDFNLRGMLGELVEAMALIAQDKGLEIVLDVTQVEQSMVNGDPGRIRQIITNLISNAIKFTGKGEIIIRIVTTPVGQTKLLLHCLVEDTGMGVPPEKLSTLFDTFSQVDASTTRKFGGTGLGLSICKKLCELMDGDIHASSVLGHGSAFEFSLVIKSSSQSEHVIPHVDISTLNLLIVDDNNTNREVLRGQLEHWGATVTEARNAKNAVLLCQQHYDDPSLNLFDVAFIDMQMPDTDGAALGEILRDHLHFNTMKMVMMTSISQGNEVDYFTNIGFNAFFSKPATTEDLFGALSVVSNKDAPNMVTHNYLQSLIKDDEESPVHTSSAQWPKSAKILLVEDNKINQMVAIGVLESLGFTADIAENGIEAINALKLAGATQPYSLILMDCQMPEMDGYQATDAIRKHQQNEFDCNITVVAMTANAMLGDQEKCLQAGMSDYLSKPIDPDLLLEKLEKYLIAPPVLPVKAPLLDQEKQLTANVGTHTETAISGSQQTPAVGDSKTSENIGKLDNRENTLHVEASVTPDEEQLIVWDKVSCLKRVRNNEKLLNMLMNAFITDVPEYVKHLQQAIVDIDFTQIHHQAHAIKGIAGNLSGLVLHHHASELELAAKNENIEKIQLMHPMFIIAFDELLALFQHKMESSS